MVLPIATNYPLSIDNDTNLFLVKDSLRLRLNQDYNPGDTSIYVEGDADVISKFPQNGIITLTEQCSDIDLRAISFYYNSIDYENFIFDEIELLDGFIDCIKLKKITNVTQNVMSVHHNHLKDALIAIETFLGIKGTIDNAPNGPTIEGRTNFLRKIALRPRAWFNANKRVGLVPLEVTFKDLSFRLATDGVEGSYSIIWDFGDNTTSIISTISTTEIVPLQDNIIVQDLNAGTIKKTYLRPGSFDVTLTVKNKFGQDVCKFSEYINARIESPEEAVINILSTTPLQITTPGEPLGGPFTTVPKIRTPINTLITLSIPNGENPSTPGVKFSGEFVGLGDPIESYTWLLGDDLLHSNSSETKASYGVGGIYDVKLRVDTKAKSYRITSYENAIDVIEKTNLWFSCFDNPLTPNIFKVYEYGLISETFKLQNAPSYSITRNDAFLDGVPEESAQKREFARNVLVSPVGTANSGLGGLSRFFYSSGRNSVEPIISEKIKMFEFNAFGGSFITSALEIDRAWNWVGLTNNTEVNFLFGTTNDTTINTSIVNPSKTKLMLNDLSITNDANFLNIQSNLKNGAEELKNNPSLFNNLGESVYGDFSIYRSTWKDNNGYFLRNSSPSGNFLRIKSFYRTEGTLGTPITGLRKMPDMAGTVKIEGEITALSLGLYFFNNSGSISKFDVNTSVWQPGGPGLNSLAYRSLQDTTKDGFDDLSQELFIASDKDKRAYITYRYSERVFLKFNETTTTFTALGTRPVGKIWTMEAY